jgi:hypothetical protein
MLLFEDTPQFEGSGRVRASGMDRCLRINSESIPEASRERILRTAPPFFLKRGSRDRLDLQLQESRDHHDSCIGDNDQRKERK